MTLRIGQQPPGGSHPQGGRGAAVKPHPAAGGVQLRLHIDRLTLPGMSRAASGRVVNALQRELAKLAGGSPRRRWRNLSVIGRLDGGTVREGARPEQVGEHLAAQIFRRLSP